MREATTNMANGKNYENIEKIGGLLGPTGLGALQKKIGETEGKLSDILKKISTLESEKRRAEEAQTAEPAPVPEEVNRVPEVASRQEVSTQEEKTEAKPEVKEEPKKAEKEEASAPEKKAEEKPSPAKESDPSEKKPDRPSYIKDRPSDRPSYIKDRPSDRPSYIKDRPSDRPSYIKDRPSDRPSYIKDRPSDRPSYIKDRPSDRPSYNRERTPGTRPTFVNRDARPQGGRPLSPRPATSVTGTAKPAGKTFIADKKKSFEKTYVEKKPVSKRSLLKQQGMSIDDFDENKSGYRKMRPAKKQKSAETQTIKIDHVVITTKEIQIKALSEKLGISAVEITKHLFKEGVMKTVNESVDADNAALIAADFGIELEYIPEKTAEDALKEAHEDVFDENAVPRAPIVTVMGHVDHGKTSLLDAIRKTNVTDGEAGGITQSIGAYSITVDGHPITFIDTPGHEAFTAMRARGAQVTDIVVLVVAGDDGIMPQTVEAINHAKAADVPIIVAVNKMDKPQSDMDRVKNGLLEYGLVPEEWGGDVMLVPVSAKTGMGIDTLLENIYLLAEMLELKADPTKMAKGTIIEAKLDKGKGPMASVLVQNGTLRVGDNIISGMSTGRVRAMIDDKGRMIKEAGPSIAVSVLGFEEVPSAGDSIYAVDQALMKQVQEERHTRERESMIKETSKVTLDDVFAQVAEGKLKDLNIIVKGDVQGSVEAVKQSLLKLSNEEVKVKVIHAAAGAITESDIMLADSSHAIVVGFNVRPDTKAKALAERSKVDVRMYRIIYELLDDIEAALKGMLAPKYQEIYMGKCEVRQTFKITGVGMVAGCYVTDGKLIRGGKLRIYRDDVMIVEGNVRQLKRFKDDVKEVSAGFECGCSIENFDDIQIGDFIECYLIQEIKPV